MHDVEAGIDTDGTEGGLPWTFRIVACNLIVRDATLRALLANWALSRGSSRSQSTALTSSSVAR